MTVKQYTGRANINIYHGDCMEFMKDKPAKSYDLAICDPPYGIKIADWDNVSDRPTNEYFNYIFNYSNNQIIWGGNYFDLPKTQSWICWDKTYKYNQKLNIAEFELAWCSLDIKAKFIRYTYCGNFYGFESPSADYNKPKNIHPTQKPVALYKWLLTNYAKAGDKILDTHGGSMSIAIACWDLGFDLDIIELDKDYYDKAVERFERHINQKQLF